MLHCKHLFYMYNYGNSMISIGFREERERGVGGEGCQEFPLFILISIPLKIANFFKFIICNPLFIFISLYHRIFSIKSGLKKINQKNE